MSAPRPESDRQKRPLDGGRPQRGAAKDSPQGENAEFIRAANEDDDGYDPYSDRRPSSEPLFERDPWG